MFVAGQQMTSLTNALPLEREMNARLAHTTMRRDRTREATFDNSGGDSIWF